MKTTLTVVLTFILTLILATSILAEDLFTDLPSDHWAREAVNKLAEEGFLRAYPDNTFRGEQVITRYELAVVISKILERIEALEVVSSEKSPSSKKEEAKPEKAKISPKLSPENLTTLEKLIQEFRPELESMGKKVSELESKLTEMEKDVKKQEKEIKKLKRDIKKDLSLQQRDVKSLKKEVEGLRDQLDLINISGSGSFWLEGKDYAVKGISETTPYGFNEKYVVKAPRSEFNAYNGLSLSLRAHPYQAVRSDKMITVSADFGASRGGSPGKEDRGPHDIQDYDLQFVKHDSADLEMGNFSLDYVASRSKFSNLSVGDCSTGWTFLSLSIAGYSFKGAKAKGSIGKTSYEMVVAKPQYAHIDKDKYYFNEYLYGLKASASYGAKNDLLFLTYMKNFHDKDSISFKGYDAPLTWETGIELKKPDMMEVVSVYTRYSLLSSVYFTGEYSYSKYTQWQGMPCVTLATLSSPPYYDPTIGEPISLPKSGDCKVTYRRSVPTIKEKDSALIALFDYNKGPISAMAAYARQNPKYHNRYGGIMGLIGGFGGGGLEVGGLDIGSLVEGLEIYLFRPTYNPPWAKGLTITNTLVVGGEIKPSKLTTLPEQFDVALTGLDRDTDRRTHKIKFTFFWPELSYKPTPTTTLSLNCMFVNAGIEKELITGSDSVSFSMCIRPDEGSPWKGGSDPLSPLPGHPWMEWLDENVENGSRLGIIYTDRIEFGHYDDTYSHFVKEDNLTQYIHLAKGEAVNLDLPGRNIEYMGEVLAPASGEWVCNEVLYESAQAKPGGKTEDEVNQMIDDGESIIELYRIVQKPLELKIKVLMPSFKVTHEFSDRLTYKLQYSDIIIKIPKGRLPGLEPEESGLSLVSIIQSQGIKAERLTTWHQSFNYKLSKTINVTLDYDMDFKKYFSSPGGDGHREKLTKTKFTVTLNF